MNNIIFFNVFSLLIGLSFSQYYERPQHSSYEDSSFESSYELPWDTCSKRETRGRCQPLSQCQTLKSYLRERNKHEVSFILQKYGCGFRKDSLHVCCPTNNIQDERTTRRPHRTTNTHWYDSDLTSTQKDSWFWPKPTTTEETWRKPTEDPYRRTTEDPYRRTTEDPYRRTTEDQYRRTTSTSRPTRSTTSFWPSRRTTTRKTENLFYGDNDITNHRNRRLLPLDTCGADLGDRIIGGGATRLDEFPWAVLLQHSSTDGRRVGFGCGGSLISSRYVVTAAHCITGPGVPRNIRVTKVRLGEYDISKKKDCQGSVCSPDPIDAPVEDIIIHENYKPNDKAQYNDIALIRLRNNIQMNAFISPICLPLDSIQNKNYQGEKFVVAGWGRTTNTKGPNSSAKIKQSVNIPYVDFDECSPFYIRNGINLKNTQLCAGGQKGKDSCQGDSGGPLMSADVIDSEVRWHLQGVVSFGAEFCGTENAAGVYTRVSKYLNWILDNMKD